MLSTAASNPRFSYAADRDRGGMASLLQRGLNNEIVGSQATIDGIQRNLLDNRADSSYNISRFPSGIPPAM